MSDITAIPVNGAKGFVIIDAEDYEKVSKFNLQLEDGSKPGSVYISCQIDGTETDQKRIRLSHLILGIIDDKSIHRIKYLNQNPFDLRKSNLSVIKYGGTSNNSDKLYIYFDKSRSRMGRAAWIVTAYINPRTHNICLCKSHEAAEAVIEYIKNLDLPLITEEVGNLKLIVRKWAADQGHANLHSGRLNGHKTYAIGDEKIDDRNSIRVKTEKGWILKHHLIWKQHGKRLLKNHFLVFRDGNNRNFNFSNLELISASEQGFRNSLRRLPDDVRRAKLALIELQKEIERQSKKKTQKVKIFGTDKFAIVDTEDYQKVLGVEWKLLDSRGRRIIGYHTRIGEKYKLVTLAQKILDVEDKSVRITHLNRRKFDFRRVNLKVTNVQSREVKNV